MNADDRSIYERIADVLADLPAIGKDQRNAQQGFNFRGIDDVLNALNPMLAKHGVFYVPEVLERVTEERATKSGGVMYVTHLHVRYRFYGLKGDYIEASGWGEGTDSGDKATPKAMTGAMKYVLFQTFAISTEEASKNDSDAHTPEETMSGAQQVSERIGALSEPEKARLREEWKSAGLPAPRRLRGEQVAAALRLVESVVGFEDAGSGAEKADGADGDAGPAPSTNGHTPPTDEPLIDARQQKGLHIDMGNVAKTLGHLNSKGGGDSKWADLVLDALVLNVTGGRTSSTADLTVGEYGRLVAWQKDVGAERVKAVAHGPDSVDLVLADRLLSFARGADGTLHPTEGAV
jgi:hypothetical protein